MKKTIKHEYKCDECDNPAEYNLQNWWHLYEIDNRGKFTEIDDWEGEGNSFYCQKHFDEV